MNSRFTWIPSIAQPLAEGTYILTWNAGQQWLWTSQCFLLQTCSHPWGQGWNNWSVNRRGTDPGVQLQGLNCGTLGDKRCLNPESHKVRGWIMPIFEAFWCLYHWLCAMSLVPGVLWYQPQKKHCMHASAVFILLSHISPGFWLILQQKATTWGFTILETFSGSLSLGL